MREDSSEGLTQSADIVKPIDTELFIVSHIYICAVHPQKLDR